MKKLCNAMVRWVDARVDSALAYHNRRFHSTEIRDAAKVEMRMEEREKVAKAALKKVM